MGIQELAHTRDLMLATGYEHFDMDAWFQSPGTFVASIPSMTPDALHMITKCETTACFAGFGRLAAFQQGLMEPMTHLEVADWLGVEYEVFQPGSWKSYFNIDDYRGLNSLEEWVKTDDYKFLNQTWTNFSAGVAYPTYPDYEGDGEAYAQAGREFGQACDAWAVNTKKAEFNTILAYIDWKMARLAVEGTEYQYASDEELLGEPS